MRMSLNLASKDLV